MKLDWEKELSRFDCVANASEDTAAKMHFVRLASKEFAKLLVENVPDCADKSAAIRCVREAANWANAAIAHNAPDSEK